MKKSVLNFLVLFLLQYPIALLGKPFLLIAYHFLFSIIVCGFLYYRLLDFICKINGDVQRSAPRKYTERLQFVFMVSGTIFFSGLISLSLYLTYCPQASRLLTAVGVLILSIFLGMNLMKVNKARIVILVLSTAALIYLAVFLKTGQMIFFSFVGENPEDRLKALSYASWGAIKDNFHGQGVVVQELEKSFPGINIYNPQHLPAAYLVDNNGNLRHVWYDKAPAFSHWHYIELGEGGSLSVIVEDVKFMQISENSDLLGELKTRAHHDFFVDGSGDIYLLSRKDEIIWFAGMPIPILNDYILVLSPDRKIKREISIFNSCKEYVPAKSLLKIYLALWKPTTFPGVIMNCQRFNWEKLWLVQNSVFDIFHTNSLKIAKRTIPGLCRKGDFLLSLRNLNTVMIVDQVSAACKWQWGKQAIIRQHDASFLENGDILIFDNGMAPARNYSRVIEVNPVKKEIAWEYLGDPREDFFSPIRGGVQKLPNGNLLVADSESGRAFEVTRKGRLVWEFLCPHIIDSQNRRAKIYRFNRITDPEKLFWLNEKN